MGTDTAGSVRIPAALCGLVGFKPTRGLLSLHGVVPLSPSQDTIGVIAETVDLAAAAVLALPGRTSFPAATRAAPGPQLDLVVPSGWVGDLCGGVAAAWRVAAELPTTPFVSRQTAFDSGQLLQGFEAHRVHEQRLWSAPDANFNADVRGPPGHGRLGRAGVGAAGG